MTPVQPQPAGGPPPVAPPAGRRLRRGWQGVVADRIYVGLISLAALIAVAVVAYLIIKTVQQAGLVRDQIGIRKFLTGTTWSVPEERFGALPLIYGTLATSAIALVLAVPVAIGAAIATTVFLPRRIRGPVAALIDLLAAVPSVVYGLWGVVVLLPRVRPVLDWLAAHSHGIGAIEGPVLGGSILAAGLVLAVMILPIVTAVIREVLATVPIEQREAALALGATRWEMIRGSMLPWARSGIVGASALGLGRAVGETIAVFMVVGNVPALWSSVVRPGQTLAGTVANEWNSASGPLHTAALVALGVTLFALAFLVNLVARALVSRGSGRRRVGPAIAAGTGALRTALGSAWARVRPAPELPGSPWMPAPIRRGLPSVQITRRIRSGVADAAIGLSVIIALVLLGLILAYAVAKGVGSLSGEFFTRDGEPDVVGNGIKHALVGTLILMGIATVVSVPIGILTALFMRECAARGRVLRRAAAGLGLFVDMLLGVPSIVAGLVVALTVVKAMGHYSALAGGLALALIIFPIVVRSADEVLRLVPTAEVEGALALGAPRWRTTWSVVLPAALPGMLTGVMLALARASGETAPLLLTSLGAQFFSKDLLQPIAALPQYIFTGTINSTVPVAQSHAWGAALVLVILVLVLSLIARLIARFSRRLETR